MISRPLYGFFAARCAFVDEVFERALRAGTRQIVFLGAGYDTRALRFSADLGATRLFEVDAPSTQGRKQAVLSSSGVAVPPQLRFVAVNFKTDDFVERLVEAGYDAAVATLFIWEGVTYYLTQDTVERTLAQLHARSSPDSALAFDYMTAPTDSVNAGEPFLSFIEPQALPGWLERLGFRVREHLDAAQMADRYLTLRDGTLAEKPFSKIRFAYAERE